jgi:integrase
VKIAKGGDPASEKRNRGLDEDTVACVIEEYIARECRDFKTPEMANLLRRDLAGAYGKRSLRDIRRPDALRLVDASLDAGMPVRADKLLGVMRRLWRWAIARGYADVNPVEGIRPVHKPVARDRVLTDQEIVRVWRAAESMGHPTSAFVRLLILTGQRRNEVAGMKWSEVDLDRSRWTIPKERRKGSIIQILPLAGMTVDLLRAIPRMGDSEYVLPASRPGEHMSGFHKMKTELDRRAGVSGWRFHDLRRSCAIRLQELGTRIEVTENILGHSSGSRSGVVGIYQLAKFENEMRIGVDAWARRIQTLLGEPVSAEVVPLHA